MLEKYVSPFRLKAIDTAILNLDILSDPWALLIGT